MQKNVSQLFGASGLESASTEIVIYAVDVEEAGERIGACVFQQHHYTVDIYS